MVKVNLPRETPLPAYSFGPSGGGWLLTRQFQRSSVIGPAQEDLPPHHEGRIGLTAPVEGEPQIVPQHRQVRLDANRVAEHRDRILIAVQLHVGEAQVVPSFPPLRTPDPSSAFTSTKDRSETSEIEISAAATRARGGPSQRRRLAATAKTAAGRSKTDMRSQS